MTQERWHTHRLEHRAPQHQRLATILQAAPRLTHGTASAGDAAHGSHADGGRPCIQAAGGLVLQCMLRLCGGCVGVRVE